MNDSNGDSVIRFGLFEVDVRAGQLRKHGMRVRLQDQPFHILAVFLEQPGALVTREQLRQRLWPDGTFVDFDNSLNAAINKLREALGDSAENPRYVETLPRRGYRFIAHVEKSAQPQPAAAPPPVGEIPAIPKNGAPPSMPATLPAPVTRPRLRSAWRVAGVLLIASVLAGGYFVSQQFRAPAAASTGKVMMAVLPFQNLSGDPTQDYFSDGLTDEMIAQLGRLHPSRLGVIGRSASMRYKNSPQPVHEIGRELGVRYMLEGTVRRNGDRVRITAQLVAVHDQSQLWSETYERDIKDVLAIQQDVAGHIVNSLLLELLPAGHAVSGKPSTVSAAAFEDYLRGRYHWSRRSPHSIKKGLEYFQKAIERDPHYALAYTGIADSYLVWGGRLAGVPTNEAYPKARAAALRALELDDTLAEAHAALAGVKFEYDWDFAGAEKSMRRAIELNPAYASAHQWYAEQLAAMGRMDEALAEIRRALALEPYSLSINLVYGQILMYSRQYDAAIEQFRKLAELDPSFIQADAHLARVYRIKNMPQQWYDHWSRQVATVGASAGSQQLAAYERAFQQGGINGALRVRVRDLTPIASQYYGGAYVMVKLHAILGENDQALQWLERAADERNDFVTHVTVDPEIDSLRADPRFQRILRQIGFPAR